MIRVYFVGAVLLAALAGCGGPDDSGVSDPFVAPAAEQGATCAPIAERRCDGWDSVERVCWFACPAALADPSSGCTPVTTSCIPAGGSARALGFERECVFRCPL